MTNKSILKLSIKLIIVLLICTVLLYTNVPIPFNKALASNIYTANEPVATFKISDEVNTIYFNTQLSTADVVEILEVFELEDSMEPLDLMLHNVDIYVDLSYLVVFYISGVYLLGIADGDNPVFIFSSESLVLYDNIFTAGWQNLDNKGSYTFANIGTVTNILYSDMWNGILASPEEFM